MPDVSKNTQLEGTANALVGSVDDIDETWQKLRFSQSDQKLLLKKKLSEINKISQLQELKDTEKVVLALSQIINAMKDLQRLASEHYIESKLYSGEN